MTISSTNIIALIVSPFLVALFALMMWTTLLTAAIFTGVIALMIWAFLAFRVHHDRGFPYDDKTPTERWRLAIDHHVQEVEARRKESSS